MSAGPVTFAEGRAIYVKANHRTVRTGNGFRCKGGFLQNIKRPLNIVLKIAHRFDNFNKKKVEYENCGLWTKTSCVQNEQAAPTSGLSAE